MRRNTISFAAACLAFQALAMWSASQGGGDLIVNILCFAWLVCLLAVFLVLCWHTGDLVFRLPAFLLTCGYSIFIAYTIWDLFTSFD